MTALQITVPPSRYVVRVVIDPDLGIVNIATEYADVNDWCPPGLPAVVIEPWPPT